MDNEPRRRLRSLLEERGPSLVRDPALCRGLLMDYCGEFRAENAALLGALSEGVPSALQAAPPGVPSDATVAAQARRLQRDLNMTAEAARWAVESWAFALGLSGSEAAVPAGGEAEEWVGGDEDKEKEKRAPTPIEEVNLEDGAGEKDDRGQKKPIPVSQKQVGRILLVAAGIGVVVLLLVKALHHPAATSAVGATGGTPGIQTGPGPGPISGPGPERQPQGNPSPASAVDPALVGTWQAVNGQTQLEWTITASGGYEFMGKYGNQGSFYGGSQAGQAEAAHNPGTFILAEDNGGGTQVVQFQFQGSQLLLEGSFFCTNHPTAWSRSASSAPGSGMAQESFVGQWTSNSPACNGAPANGTWTVDDTYRYDFEVTYWDRGSIAASGGAYSKVSVNARNVTERGTYALEGPNRMVQTARLTRVTENISWTRIAAP